MSSVRQRLGRWGETMAARHLEQAGYCIVERNYRCPEGEMDIVARRGPQWVFVEVKTRRGDRYGPPQDAVTRTKAARLVRIGECYLQEHQLTDVDWRIDVIAIGIDQGGSVVRFDHIEGAVTGW